MDVNSELRDAQLEIKDSDEAFNANQKGLIWFNRAANKVKAIYNATVEILATESYVDAEIASAIGSSEGSLESNGLVTNERSDPATPANGKAHLYAKTDGIYFRGDNGVISRLEVSSASAIKNITGLFQNYSQSTGQNAVIVLFTATETCEVFINSDVNATPSGFVRANPQVRVGSTIRPDVYFGTMTSGQKIQVELGNVANGSAIVLNIKGTIQIITKK